MEWIRSGQCSEKKRQKMRSPKSEIEFSNSYFTPKNINSNLRILPQNEVKRIFSFEKRNLRKKLKNINFSISNNKDSKNNHSPFHKIEKDYNIDDNTSAKYVKQSPKNSSTKINDKLSAFCNKKECKNYLDINKSKIEKLKKNSSFNNKNNDENNKNYEKNIKRT